MINFLFAVSPHPVLRLPAAGRDTPLLQGEGTGVRLKSVIILYFNITLKGFVYFFYT